MHEAESSDMLPTLQSVMTSILLQLNDITLADEIAQPSSLNDISVTTDVTWPNKLDAIVAVHYAK